MSDSGNEILGDEGILRLITKTQAELPLEEQLHEDIGTPRVPRSEQWLALLNQAATYSKEKLNRRIVTSAAIGGVVMTSVGFATGAVAFGRR